MTTQEIIQECKNTVAKAKLSETFTFLKIQIKNDSDISTQLILLEANYSLSKNHFRNINDYEIFTREMSRVSKSILETIQNLTEADLKEIKEKDIPENYQNMSVPVITKPPPFKNDSIHKISLEAKKMRKEGKYEEALSLWEQLPLDKQDKIAFLNEMAMLYRLMGRYEKALFILEGIRNDAPKDAKCLNELATCQRELYRLPSAIDTLKGAIFSEPHNNHLYTNLFFIYLFFSLNADEAIKVRDEFEIKTGKKLLDNEAIRSQYEQFIEHLDEIKSGIANEKTMRLFLNECVNKRANKTARLLTTQLKKMGKKWDWIRDFDIS